MATERNDFGLTCITKLNTTNYELWKRKVKVLLIERDCLEFIKGPEPVLPDQATPQEREHFRRRKNKAYTTIFLTVDDEVSSLIANAETGKEAWEILKSHFEPSSLARLAGLIDEYQQIRFQPDDESIGLYMARVKASLQKLREAGLEYQARLVPFNLIRHLPQEYDGLVQSLYRLPESEFTTSAIEKALIAEEGRIKQKKRDDHTGTVTEAMSSSHQRAHRPASKKKVQLTKPVPEQKQKQDDNSCYRCHRKGHFARNCRAPRPVPRPDSEKKSSSFYVSTLAAEYEDDQNKWILDSGATHHFCHEKTLFQTFTPKGGEVQFADGKSRVRTEGIGDVSVSTNYKGQEVLLNLKNVYYAPMFGINLVSVPKIDDAGMHTVTTNQKTTVFTPKWDPLFAARKEKGRYVIPMEEDTNRKLPKVNLAIKHNCNLWHERFGHAGIRTLRDLEKFSAIRGLALSGSFQTCDICEKAKSTRHSFPPIPEEKRTATKPLDRVFMDLWGPAPVETPGKNRYFLSIIDDYSRFATVYLLKHKSEAFEYFKRFLVSAERQTGEQLKRVRTDNGLEFCNKEFENYLIENGIVIERTSTFTPEQNGIAERYNRTIMDTVRAMLISAGVPNTFWGEALLAATHIRNRCLHPTQTKTTPIELWTGRKPSAAHLKKYGCKSYVHIQKMHRNKLQPRAEIGYLVGYAVKTRGYRVWMPDQRRVIETIHVKFDENNLYQERKKQEETHVRFFVDDFPEEEIEDQEPKVKAIKWAREVKYRPKVKRYEVFYFATDETNKRTRMRSHKDVKAFCESKGIEYNPGQFDFKNREQKEDTTFKTPPETPQQSEEEDEEDEEL